MRITADENIIINISVENYNTTLWISNSSPTIVFEVLQVKLDPEFF